MAEQRDREWTQTGEYAEMYSPEEVYDLIQQAPNQVVTTPDITNALGCNRTTARRKLRDLLIEGKIKKREPSGKITLWYLAGDSTESNDEDSEGTPVADVLAEADPDAVLKLLSRELDGPITTADGTVYEAGDKHPVADTDDDTAV